MLGAQCLHEHVLLPWGKYLKICAQNGSDSRAEAGDLHLLGCRDDLKHLGTKCVIWCCKFICERPRTAQNWRNMHLTKPEVRWDKGKKSCRTKTSQVIAMYRRFSFRMWPRGHKKLGSLPDCGRRLAFWERSFFAAQNCYCRHAKKWIHELGFGSWPYTSKYLLRCWRFRYVLGVQIHSEEVFGCLGWCPNWFHPSFFCSLVKVGVDHILLLISRNPAPPGMHKTLYIVVDSPYQLVQDFFHQQYFTHMNCAR